MAGLSDSNTRNPSASNVAFNAVYTDIPLSFKTHPIKKDILPLKDIDAVKQSVKNIILTNQTERPFQMGIGGDIVRYLFEPVSPITAFSLREEIFRTISTHEPRISNVRVSVVGNIDKNSFDVTISFNIDVSSNREEISFALERLR